EGVLAVHTHLGGSGGVRAPSTGDGHDGGVHAGALEGVRGVGGPAAQLVLLQFGPLRLGPVAVVDLHRLGCTGAVTDGGHRTGELLVYAHPRIVGGRDVQVSIVSGAGEQFDLRQAQCRTVLGGE